MPDNWDDTMVNNDVIEPAFWNDMIDDQKNRGVKGFSVEVYNGSGSTTTTTGTISASSDSLVVASATSFAINEGILVAGGTLDASDTANTDDTDQDFSTTGGNADREWMARKFTASASGLIGQIIAELGKTGSPAGTIKACIYSDDGGSPSVPSTQIGGDSDTVNCTSLSVDAGGADQTFKWSSDFPNITAATAYWVVLKTTGYTYADGITEVRWRTDADGATGLNECAKYDANAGTPWTTIGANVGADLQVGLCLVTTISAIAGTTFTLADSTTMAVTSGHISHDDTNALTTAHTAATANGGDIYFPQGTYYITSDTTINNDVSLVFANGAQLSPDNGVTITINGNIRAGTSQIFTGNGTITLGVRSFLHPIPYWWGESSFVVTFSDGDTTPSIERSEYFITANTGSTTITDLDNSKAGREVNILFDDGNTIIQSNGNIKLQGGQNFDGVQYDTLTLVYNGSVWQEKSRSLNS